MLKKQPRINWLISSIYFSCFGRFFRTHLVLTYLWHYLSFLLSKLRLANLRPRPTDFSLAAFLILEIFQNVYKTFSQMNLNLSGNSLQCYLWCNKVYKWSSKKIHKWPELTRPGQNPKLVQPRTSWAASYSPCFKMYHTFISLLPMYRCLSPDVLSPSVCLFAWDESLSCVKRYSP